MGKSVGLDIYPRGIRAVEVSGRGAKFKIIRYAHLEVEARGGALDPEAKRHALVDLFKRGFSKNHVIAAVDAHDAIVREIPVPFKSDDQIKKVVKFEAEHHLHDCDADDVIVQYTKIGESADGTNLLVFAVRKDDLSRRIEALRGAGVEPLAVDLDANAYYHAVRASGLLDESPDCVLLHIGHRATDIIFVMDGKVRGMRAVRIGVDSIASGLARDMDIDIREADRKMAEIEGDDGQDLFVPAIEGIDIKPETEKSHAELERDIFEQKRDEFLARLKREFVRSAAALRGGETPDRIIAAGPGTAVSNLLELLGQRIGQPVEPFQPSAQFNYRPKNSSAPEFDAGASVAIGLALKGIGADAIGMDFRQEELKVANKFELLKNTLAVTVTLLFLGLLVFSFYCVIKKKQLRNERYEVMLTDAYQSFSEVSRKFNGLGDLIPKRYHVDPNVVEGKGPRELAINRFVRRLKRMRNQLHDVTGSKQGIEPITSALGIWNDVFKAIQSKHKEIDYIDIETIDVRQDRMQLGVMLPSAAADDVLAAALKEVEHLKRMEAVPGGLTPVRGTQLQRTRYEFKKKRGRRGRRP